MNFRPRPILIVCFAIAAALSCEPKRNSEVVWTMDLSVIGSQSSPRAVDLNGDGTLDIVMGAGKNEYQRSEKGILAFDGATGQLLWQHPSSDQVYGSATFCDVTGDSVKDVIIGGRSPQLKAINGANGELIWEFKSARYQDHPILKYARYNFNNCVLIPDQDHDGAKDILTVNGGNSFAQPNSERDRFPAVLMILNSRNGDVLAADTMPDGKESYMSPLCFRQPGEDDSWIVFGTGGETIGGQLYLAKLSHLLASQLVHATVVASEKGHGFIAPPVLADITDDGYLDIIAISHASGLFAIDGKDRNVLWSKQFPDTECSNSFGVGYFTGDSTPDFFTFISKGQWPNSTGSVQILIDGADGNVAFMDSIGCTGYSSPVVYDLNNDGADEAIISVNEFDCSVGFAAQSPPTMESKLIAIDFMKRSVIPIDQSTGFKNIFSTPWIGDLDRDSYLDIVHCQYFHHGDLLSFLGMRIKRIELPVKIRKNVAWGAYQGSEGNGIFRGKD